MVIRRTLAGLASAAAAVLAAACGVSEDQQDAARELEGYLLELDGVTDAEVEPTWLDTASIEVDVEDDIAAERLVAVLRQLRPLTDSAGVVGVDRALVRLDDVAVDVARQFGELDADAEQDLELVAARATVAERAFTDVSVTIRPEQTVVRTPDGSGRLDETIASVAATPELSAWEGWTFEESDAPGNLVLRTTGRVTPELAGQWRQLHASVAGLDVVLLRLEPDVFRVGIRPAGDPDLAAVTPRSHPEIAEMIRAQGRVLSVSSRPRYVVEVYGEPDQEGRAPGRTLAEVPPGPGSTADPEWSELARRAVQG